MLVIVIVIKAEIIRWHIKNHKNFQQNYLQMKALIFERFAKLWQGRKTNKLIFIQQNRKVKILKLMERKL